MKGKFSVSAIPLLVAFSCADANLLPAFEYKAPEPLLACGIEKITTETGKSMFKVLLFEGDNIFADAVISPKEPVPLEVLEEWAQHNCAELFKSYEGQTDKSSLKPGNPEEYELFSPKEAQ